MAQGDAVDPVLFSSVCARVNEGSSGHKLLNWKLDEKTNKWDQIVHVNKETRNLYVAENDVLVLFRALDEQHHDLK